MSTAQSSAPGMSLDLSEWLRRKVRSQSLLLTAAGVAFCAVGAILVYLSYLGIRLGLDWLNDRYLAKDAIYGGWKPNTIRIGAGLITALLFALYHVVEERFTEEFDIELSEKNRVKVTVAQYTDYGWTRMFEGWHFLLFFLRVVSAVLFLGPQTVSAGLRQFQRAAKLMTLDIAGCGQLIGFIASWREKVPFKVLRNKLPELELPRLLSQISYLDGVVFRKSDPPGVTLAPHIRGEILEWSSNAGQQLTMRSRKRDEDGDDE